MKELINQIYRWAFECGFMNEETYERLKYGCIHIHPYDKKYDDLVTKILTNKIIMKVIIEEHFTKLYFDNFIFTFWSSNRWYSTASLFILEEINDKGESITLLSQNIDKVRPSYKNLNILKNIIISKEEEMKKLAEKTDEDVKYELAMKKLGE